MVSLARRFKLHACILEVRVLSRLEKHIPDARLGQPVKISLMEHFTGRMFLDKLNISVKEVLIVLVDGVNKTPDDVFC